MEKSVSKRILVKFLKENNMFSHCLLYLYDYPHILNKTCPSNTKAINDTAKNADTARFERDRKNIMKNILGHTRDTKPSLGAKYRKTDYLYEAYMAWCEYIDKNWDTIKKLYERFSTE